MLLIYKLLESEGILTIKSPKCVITEAGNKILGTYTLNLSFLR